MVKHHIANANLMVSRDADCVAPSGGWYTCLLCRQVCVLGPCHVLGNSCGLDKPRYLPSWN